MYSINEIKNSPLHNGYSSQNGEQQQKALASRDRHCFCAQFSSPLAKIGEQVGGDMSFILAGVDKMKLKIYLLPQNRLSVDSLYLVNF